MDSVISSDLILKKTLSFNKVSFFLMVPMNEMHKYLRNGLLYFYNIATEHYDSLTFMRYYTEDMVFITELLIQTYYLINRKSTYGENFYGFIRSGLSSSNLLSLDKAYK